MTTVRAIALLAFALCPEVCAAAAPAVDCAMLNLPGYLAFAPALPNSTQAVTVTVGRYPYVPASVDVVESGRTLDITLTADYNGFDPQPEICTNTALPPLSPGNHTVNLWLIDRGMPQSAPLFLTSKTLEVAPGAPVSISPSSPTVSDMVFVHAPMATGYDLGSTKVSMAGNKITVEASSSDFAPLPPSFYNLNWPVGRLPAGTYQVEVVYDKATLGTSQFTVARRPDQVPGCTVHPCGPVWDHTDMWWNPSESGWGASIVQHDSGNIFGVLFLYADNGAATWYVLPGGQWISTAEFDGPLYRTRGPQLDAFDPNSVNASVVGSAKLAFDDGDPGKATLTLTIDGKTIQKSIQRQAY